MVPAISEPWAEESRELPPGLCAARQGPQFRRFFGCPRATETCNRVRQSASPPLPPDNDDTDKSARAPLQPSPGARLRGYYFAKNARVPQRVLSSLARAPLRR